MNLDPCRSALSTLSEEAFAGSTKPTSLRLYPTGSNVDESGIAVYYAPLEAVNPNARVILVGITPGASQMRRAWNSARSVLRAGGDLDSAMSEVKRVSAFNDDSGQMRPNLYAQLEDWGVHSYLGHPSGASLFAAGWSDIQTTSLLPFPTFSNDRNYEGKAPSPLKHPVLRSLILDRFVPLLRSMPSALLLPLGVTVERVVQELYALGVIANPCASGLLHPSGQNTYRLKYLCGPRTGPVPGKTNVETYDRGKQAFRVRHLQNAP